MSAAADFAQRLRPAEPRDVPRMAELWGRMCEEKGETHFDVGGWAAQTAALMASGSYVGVVAGEEPVGLVDGIAVYEPALSLVQLAGRTLYLEPAWRGCGLGTALVVAGLDAAYRAGARELVTDSEPVWKVWRKVYRPAGNVREYARLRAGGY